VVAEYLVIAAADNSVYIPSMVRLRPWTPRSHVAEIWQCVIRCLLLTSGRPSGYSSSRHAILCKYFADQRNEFTVIVKNLWRPVPTNHPNLVLKQGHAAYRHGKRRVVSSGPRTTVAAGSIPQ
jgi:hypothetical protein